jgi:hypothetical protein
MKQGTRVVVGAIAVMGMLATAGPAMAADRVIAVDGVAKGNADRRVEILVHVPAGQSAHAAAEKALAGQDAKKAPPPPEEPQSQASGASAAPRSRAFDLQSVYLHENGHVAGLGHSTDTSAVMYPSYQTARCALGDDDKAGIAALY